MAKKKGFNLISCKECGKKISKNAEFCPHCGFRFKRSPDLSITKGITTKRDPWLAAFLGILFGPFGFIYLNRWAACILWLVVSLFLFNRLGFIVAPFLWILWAVLQYKTAIKINKEFEKTGHTEQKRSENGGLGSFITIIIIIILILYGINELAGTSSKKINEQSFQPELKPVSVSDKRKVIGYSTNQDIDLDYLTYRITKVETFTKMGTSFFEKETTGKFIKVYLDITNNAGQTKQILSPRFKILDHKQRGYERLFDDMFYIADALEFGKQIHPGLKVSGAIVFELPKDSRDLRLSIKGDWLSISEVEVDLTRIQNIYRDRTLEWKQEKIMSEAMEESERKVKELMEKYS